MMRVSVLRLVTIVGNRGARQRFVGGLTPSFEYRVRRDCDFGGFRVIEIYLVLIVDGCVAHVCKFAGAEE